MDPTSDRERLARELDDLGRVDPAGLDAARDRRLGRPSRRLAVYGSLVPGASNHAQLAGLVGTWREGSVRGRLQATGWGAARGYPALVPDADGPAVAVRVLESDALPGHWARLDAFEGQDYRRVLVVVELAGGGACAAWLYAAARAAGG